MVAATGPIQFLPQWDANSWARKLYLKHSGCAPWGEREEESSGEEVCTATQGTPTDTLYPPPLDSRFISRNPHSPEATWSKWRKHRLESGSHRGSESVGVACPLGTLPVKRGCLTVLVRPGASWGLSVSSMGERAPTGLPLLAGGANNPTQTMLLPGPNPWPDVGLAKGPLCASGPPASSMITSSAFSRHTPLAPALVPSRTLSPAFSLREQECPFRVKALCFPLPGPSPVHSGSRVPSSQGSVCLSQEACLLRPGSV